MGLKETLTDISEKNPLHKAKAFYFLFDAAVKSLPRHLGLYYKHTLLLSPHQVAMLLSVRPFILIFGSPVLGSIADKTNKFRLVIQISLIALLITYILVPLVEPVEGFNCKEHVHFNQSGASNGRALVNLTTNSQKLQEQVAKNIDRMSTRVHTYYQMLEENGDANSSSTHLYNGNLMRDLYYTWPFDMYEYALTDDITARVFNFILVITIVGEFFGSPTETFADLYTLRALGQNKNQNLFGLQILPGVFGFFLLSISFAAVTNIRLTLQDDFCHVGHIINYSPYLFVVYALIGLCLLIASTFKYKLFPKPQRRNGRSSNGCCSTSCNFITALPVFAETPAYTAYAIAVIFCGFACGVKQLYVYQYLTELGGQPQLIFVILCVHLVSGSVSLLISPILLDRFGSKNLIAAGLLFNGVSFVVYAVIKNPWLILTVEPLNGLCQELTWVAIVTYAGAPPQIGAALQGTVHGLHKGLGFALGYYAVCVLILRFGYSSFFLGTGIFFFMLFGFYFFVIRMYPKDESIAESYNGSYTKLGQSPEDDGSEDGDSSDNEAVERGNGEPLKRIGKTKRANNNQNTTDYDSARLDDSFLEKTD